MSTPGLQPLLDAIDAAGDPGTKHALQLVAEHVLAEIAGDLPRLFATLVPDPAYRFWGYGGHADLANLTQVQEFYDRLVGTGKHRLDYVLSRVVADASTVITEGVIHHVLDGTDLHGRVSAVVEPGHWYHVTYQCLIVWPIDPATGLLSGEEVYLGEEHTVVREIAPDEFPHLGSEFRVTGKL